MKHVSEVSCVESVPRGNCLLSRWAPLAPCQAWRFAPDRNVGVLDGGWSLHTLSVLAEWLCMQPPQTSALFNWLAPSPFSLSLPFLFSLEGDALLDAGESMKRLAEVKDSLDIEVKQNFIDPLQNLCDKDLKEIQVNTLMFFSPPHLFHSWPLLAISACNCLLCCGENQGLA